MTIGTSDGQQYEDQFQHALAVGDSTMPRNDTEKPTGELKSNMAMLPSQFPPAPSPEGFDKLVKQKEEPKTEWNLSDMLMHAREFIHGEDQPTKEQIAAGNIKPLWGDLGKGVGLGLLAMGEKLGTGGLPRMYRSPQPPASVPALERAKALGYDQPVFHGTVRGFEGEKLSVGEGEGNSQRGFYSTSSPELASKYAGAEEGREPYNRHEIVPLLLNTKNYHVVDAGGATWAGKGVTKIEEGVTEALKNKKDGVIIRNIHDEPSGSSKHLPPQDVFITLKGETARSWFAKFDPANIHLNDLLASGLAAIIPAKTMTTNKDK